MSSSKSKSFLKAFVRLVVLLGFLGFLIAEAHPKSRIRAFGEVVAAHVVNEESSGNTKRGFVEALSKRRNKHRLLSKLQINYSNKRKVPNGPDPIHNRRAGKSHRPPGHV